MIFFLFTMVHGNFVLFNFLTFLFFMQIKRLDMFLR